MLFWLKWSSFSFWITKMSVYNPFISSFTMLNFSIFMFLILHASTCLPSQLWMVFSCIYANCVINTTGILNDPQHFDCNLSWWDIIRPYNTHPFIFLDRVVYNCILLHYMKWCLIKLSLKRSPSSSIFLYHWCQLLLSDSWNHHHILNYCVESAVYNLGVQSKYS